MKATLAVLLLKTLFFITDGRSTHSKQDTGLQHGNLSTPTSNVESVSWQDCPFCGISKRNRIVGGRKASIKESPWTVDIRKNGVQHCGGSVIRNRYILTAAHCVAGLDIASFTVIASVSDVIDKKAFKSKVESGHYHPQFDHNTFNYDVAVLKLVKTLPFGKGVVPVCLPKFDDNPVGENAIVSGWGALKEAAQTAPNELQNLGVPIVSNRVCQHAKGLENQKITDNMLCAGYLDGNKDACSGDSGGPLVWHNKGVWKQIGIVSWGIGCARADYYGIYTKVAEMMSWIAQNTDESMC